MCFSRQQKFEGGIHGLVVVISAFLIWVCTFGTSVSIGLYNEAFQETFQATYASVSLIGAINLGIFHCVGCGNGFAVVSAQVLCGAHYNKYKGLTSSVVLSGNGGGATLLPLIISHFIKAYGWRGSLLLLCGLNLHLLPLALALFPAESKCFEKDEVQEQLMTKDRNEANDNNKNVLQPEVIETLISKKNVEKSQDEKCTKHVTKMLKKEFLIFLFSVMTNQMGLGSVVIFLPQYAMSTGLNPSDASLSLSLIGVGFFVGCIVAGLLGKQLQLTIYTTGCIGFGIFITLMEGFQKRVGHLCLSTVSGFFAGFQFAPLFIITIEILGDKVIDIGFGYVMFAVGIGLTAGPPCAGLLIDALGETKYMIYFNCAVTLLSGFVMIPLLVRQLLKRGQTSGQVNFIDQEHERTLLTGQ